MKKIIIIEDETQTRNLFLKSLEFEGFRAYGASDGWEGIQLAQSCGPDLIICDIMMPDIDGYDVLSHLRRTPKTAAIPFIFLTAKVTMADLRHGMDLGADDYLTKPCTVEQFLAAIATRLKRQEDLLQWYQRSSPPLPDPTPPSSRSIFPDCSPLTAVFQYIETHYNQVLHLNDVARAVGYSPAYLTHLLHKQTGRTVKQWIIERRMVQARELLQTTSTSIRTIAEQVGYTDAGYFSRQFRQLYGLSPQQWRQQNPGE